MDEREQVAPADDVQALRLTLSEQTKHLDSLRARLDEMAKRQIELRELLLEAHRNLARRDEEIEQLHAEMVEEIRRRERDIELKDSEIDHRGHVIDEAQETIRAMQQTRVWRTGQTLWRARDRMRGRR